MAETSQRFRELAQDRVVGKEGTRGVAGGVPFDPPNCQGITKLGSNCRAPRANGTMYCIGHLRSMDSDGN